MGAIAHGALVLAALEVPDRSEADHGRSEVRLVKTLLIVLAIVVSIGCLAIVARVVWFLWQLSRIH